MRSYLLVPLWERLYVTVTACLLIGSALAGEVFSALFFGPFLLACGVELFRVVTQRRSALHPILLRAYRALLLITAGAFAAIFHWQNLQEQKKEFLTPGSFCRELLGVSKTETWSLKQLGLRALPRRPDKGTPERTSNVRPSVFLHAPRNLVVLLVDTLRPDALSCYNPKMWPTATFDRLASEGVLFEAAYSTTNWTRAAVGTLMTGLYPSEHGITLFDHALAPEAFTLAEAFQQCEFHTAAFITNAMLSPEYGFQQGFDVFYEAYAARSSGVPIGTAPPSALHSAPQSLPDAYRSVEIPSYMPRFEQLLPPIEKWLAERPAKPFFCYIHTVDPHEPYSPPGEFVQSVAKRVPEVLEPSHFDFGSYEAGRQVPSATDVMRLRFLYQAEVEYTDHRLDKLMELFRKAGALENTVVVILSDHGEEFYEHKGFMHGWTLHEHQVRIPLIFWSPALWKGGTRIREPFSLVDLFPTLLTAAGIAIEPNGRVSGSSWLDSDGVWHAKNKGTAVFMEADYNHCSTRVILQEDRKLFYLPRHRRLALFNLDTDPQENQPKTGNECTNNVRRMYAQLEQWQKQRQPIVSKAPGPTPLDKEALENLRHLGYLGR